MSTIRSIPSPTASRITRARSSSAAGVFSPPSRNFIEVYPSSTSRAPVVASASRLYGRHRNPLAYVGIRSR